MECRIDQDGEINSSTISKMLICSHGASHDTRTGVKSNTPAGSCSSLTVVWTGHVLKNNPSSISWVPGCSSIVMTLHHTTRAKTDGSGEFENRSTDYIDDQYVYLLIHEIGHQFNTDDHYCPNDCSGTDCTNKTCDYCVNKLGGIRKCVMGEHIDSIEEIAAETGNGIFCSECCNLIYSHLDAHHK